MLVDSPRLTPADRTHWQAVSRYDRTLTIPTSRLDKSHQVISAWAATSGAVISTSWGKDSVVICALAADTGIPIVRVRCDPYDEMPETDVVRDQFLAQYPHVRYEERTIALRNPQRGEPGHHEHVMNPNATHQDVLREAITGPYMSGVRAAESKARGISARVHGWSTTNTCRPILGWATPEVFAYLEQQHLPVHPAYAMTFGGSLDRCWLRVHRLAAQAPYSHKTDHVSWEDTYYGDVITAGNRLRSTDPRR